MASPTQPTIRYFVDKFSLFLASPVSGAPPVVTLSYVDSGFETPSHFVSHLAAYRGLFQQLKAFRFLYIAAKQAYFHKAEEVFRSMVKRPLESDVSSEILRYFQIRKKWDNHEYVIPVTADLEFLNEARRRYHGERFETLYRAWRFTELGEQDLRAEFSQLSPDRGVFFDTFLVNPHGSPFAVASGNGDACMKDTDHPWRHGSRHPGGDAKLLGRRGCAWRDIQFGRGQNTRMGWSDPTFGSLWLPKGIVGSLQPRKQGKALFAKCFARV